MHIQVDSGLTSHGIPSCRTRSADLFRLLTLVVRDSYVYCCKQLQRLATEKFPKMNDRNAVQASPQQMQLLELVRKLVSLDVQGVDKVMQALLRQIQGGNVRETNRWLARIQLQIMLENKAWLLQQRSLIPIVFYTFCRIAADHTDAKLEKMRRQEATLCCMLWRERSAECRTIGRDAIRILQDVARIPEFEQLWGDLVERPQTVGIRDIWNLLSVKTPNHILASRLTPEMEQQLLFIMNHVKMGQQQRYQKWFMARWGLTTPEGETLIPDLIRYICCVYHPPNEVIRSDVVQRWAAVGWLLTTAKGETNKAKTKLALFYDWLFFERRTKEKPQGDSVMVVEPAALLIVRSIPKWIDITSDLMEFLLAAADDWCPRYKQLCRKGVYNAAAECVKLGVIAGWDRVSAFPQLGSGLRSRVRAQLNGLCKEDPEKPSKEDVALFRFDPAVVPPPQAPVQQPSPHLSPLSSPQTSPVTPPGGLPIGGRPSVSPASTASGGEAGGAGVEEEEDEVMLSSDSEVGDGGESGEGNDGAGDSGGGVASSKLLAVMSRGDDGGVVGVEEMRELLMGEGGGGGVTQDDVIVKMFGEEVRAMWADAVPAKSPRRGRLLSALVAACREETEQVTTAAADLCAHLQCGAQGEGGPVPLMSLSLLSCLCTGGIGDASAGASRGTLKLYRRALEAEEARSGGQGISDMLLRDLRGIFAEDGGSLLFDCIPAVLTEFPDESVGRDDVIQLVCAACSPGDLASLCTCLQLGECQLLCQHAQLLAGEEAAADQLLQTLVKSMKWESFEQHALWRIFAAEFGGSLACMELLLPKILAVGSGGSSHPELLSGLACMLSSMPPSPVLLSSIAIATGQSRRHVSLPLMVRWETCQLASLASAVAAVVGGSDPDVALGLLELLNSWSFGEGLATLVAVPEVHAALTRAKESMPNMVKTCPLSSRPCHSNLSRSLQSHKESNPHRISRPISTSVIASPPALN